MQATTTTTTLIPAQAPNIDAVDELGSTMKQLLSPADHELMADEKVRSLISYVEQWAETYQRGMVAAAEILPEEMEMLKNTRSELALILSERLTLEDEGGQPANKQQAERMEHVAAAICKIDQVLPHAEEPASACAAPQRKLA